jgi:protein SCO1/2
MVARLRRASAMWAGLALLASGGALAGSTAQPPDERAALAFSQSVIDRKPPDFAFRAADGRQVRLTELRGKPLVVSFIYTGCFQACPTTTRFLAQAVDKARHALGPDKFTVVSIGFNQPFDSPEALAAFARQAGIDDAHWLFLSPPAHSVDALANAFGFTYYATPKGFDHIAQVSVVDAEGAIYRQVYGEHFDLPMLVGPLKELLSGQAVRDGGLDGLWRKVKLFCTVYDPTSGMYRLNYSLFVEIAIGIACTVAVGWFLLRERQRAST